MKLLTTPKWSLAAFIVAVGLLTGVTSPGLHGQQPGPAEAPQDDWVLLDRSNAWEIWDDKTDGPRVYRRVIHLQPAAEPQPALSVRLIPDSFHQKDGNAAIYYLQAMAFLERTPSFVAKYQFETEQRDKIRDQGLEWGGLPPYSWLDSRPGELPLDEVKQYLSHTEFQKHFLAEAAVRNRCDFDRRIQDVSDPVGYLLPEIQTMRELARQQSLRFKVAIAENRVEDALQIFAQQVTMGVHLGQEPFLVSSLVGVACAQIGLSDSYYLCEHAESPNMYWALATLPNPLIDLNLALSFEREFLFQQFKPLRDVDEVPKSEEYWQEFLKDFGSNIQQFANSMGDVFPATGDAAFWVTTGYPGARRYLKDVSDLSDETLDSLPKAQVFFLAMRRYHEHMRDELYKAYYAPSNNQQLADEANAELEKTAMMYGYMTSPTRVILPALQAVRSAQLRLQHQVAILQTVEAIRLHLAINDNQLPDSLDQLELPAPLNPATNRPFDYKRHDQGATLIGGTFPGLRYVLELRAGN